MKTEAENATAPLEASLRSCKNYRATTTHDRAHKDPYVQPFLRSKTTRMETFVQDVVSRALGHEIRSRKRSPKQLEQFERQIEMLLCNAVHFIDASKRSFSVPFSKDLLGRKSRYKPDHLKETFVSTANTLVAMGLFELQPGEHIGGLNGRGQRTLLTPTHALEREIEARGVTAQDIEVGIDGETIVLRKPDPNITNKRIELEYVDDDTTRRYRQEMQLVNAYLITADIEVAQGALDRHGEPIAHKVCYRYLRRVFSRGDFHSGGRLYGGFWQTMSKKDRFDHLSICGERVVELDYGQAALRILYGACGVELPPGDIYSIPDFEDCRSGIKKVIAAMLFDDGPRKKFPKGTREYFKKSHRYHDVQAAIFKAHPLLKKIHGSAQGHFTQFVESQIIVRVLLALREQNIVALPIHDAILVPVSAAEAASLVMYDAFRVVANAEPVVTRTDPVAFPKIDDLH